MHHRNPGFRALPAAIGLVAAGALLTACAEDSTPSAQSSATSAAQTSGARSSESPESNRAIATANVINQDGGALGTVEFSAAPTGTRVSVHVSGLEPGWHGFHIHRVGTCDGDFSSAGGHWAGNAGTTHASHAGDMPSLLAHADGTARMSFETDRFVPQELLDAADGTAVIVHAGPDNFGNIPERYAPNGPDKDTLATGDAGPRFGCGVIEAAG